MAWDCYIDRVEKEDKGIAIICTFTNNVDQKFQQDFHFTSGTKDAVFRSIEIKLADLNTVSTLPTDIPLGLFTPPPPPDPTPDQLARAAFATDLLTLERMYHALSMNVISTAYPPYIALQEDIMQRFSKHPEYIDLF
jgi:hypothetical protein